MFCNALCPGSRQTLKTFGACFRTFELRVRNFSGFGFAPCAKERAPENAQRLAREKSCQGSCLPQESVRFRPVQPAPHHIVCGRSAPAAALGVWSKTTCCPTITRSYAPRRFRPGPDCRRRPVPPLVRSADSARVRHRPAPPVEAPIRRAKSRRQKRVKAEIRIRSQEGAQSFDVHRR